MATSQPDENESERDFPTGARLTESTEGMGMENGARSLGHGSVSGTPKKQNDEKKDLLISFQGCPGRR